MGRGTAEHTTTTHFLGFSLIMWLYFLFTSYKPSCSVSLWTFSLSLLFLTFLLSDFHSHYTLTATKWHIDLQKRIKLHPTGSASLHFPYDKKHIYNGGRNKLNTIMFCIRLWYCDTDNRVSCFLASYPIALWIISDKPGHSIQLLREATVTDWQHITPQ